MIKSLDGLRALAIGLVVLSHAGFHLEGKIGVEAFFVISGFLITKNLLDEYKAVGSVSFRNFYIRRFSRLFPALVLVAISTTIFLVIVGEFKSSYISSLVYMLTFTTDLWIWLGSEKITHFFNFSWSLGVEEQFYLVWPVILLFVIRLKRMQKPLLVLLCFGVILLSFFWRLAHSGPNHSVEALFFGPIAHLGALAGGCLVAFPATSRFFLQCKERFPRAMTLTGWSCLIGLVYVSHYPSPVPFGLDESALLFASGASIILVGYLVNNETDFLARVFGSKLLVLVGRLSYTLYLFNIIFFEVTQLILKKNLAEFGSTELAVMLVLLAIFCHLVYRFYEMPLRKMINTRQLPGVVRS